MAITNNLLSIWELCFRWAGLDPEGILYKIPFSKPPLAVRDYVQQVLNAILEKKLYCGQFWSSLSDRFYEDKAKAIRHLEAQADGEIFDRRFLQRYGILRYELAQWCDNENIPLPEFWFPYGMPEEVGYPKQQPVPADYVAPPIAPRPSIDAVWQSTIDFAVKAWEKDGECSIADMIRRIQAKPSLHGANKSDSAVRKQIAPHAPPDVRKPGRKPSK